MKVIVYCINCLEIEMDIIGPLIKSPNKKIQSQEYRCPDCKSLIQVCVDFTDNPVPVLID